jgi:SH3-like domain-containing protein
VTGLPLPRFAALRSDEVNMRSGPGTRFPIDWTYQRRELPVEIVREFELWRRIRDPEGTEGWVHQSTLMGRRSFIVRGAPGSEVMLRRRAEDQAQPIARLRPGVVGRLRACEANSPWCEAQIGEFRGHIRRADIWGVGPNEEVK